MAVFQSIKDEEYLDEAILEEAECSNPDDKKEPLDSDNGDDDDDELYDEVSDEHAIQALDETTCIYCSASLGSAELVRAHVRTAHAREPRTGRRLRACRLCGVPVHRLDEHMTRCHSKGEVEVKLCNDQPAKLTTRERKKCHMCNRDFSQKQILNKHLWKAHGFEVEKRKAFICPLCSERVSYGAHFSAHLLHAHRVLEQVEELEFYCMDDFMLFKSAIQEETKYRFRKTTASKQTIEGVRSHYMCSQSGVYVYQGKGKRPTPERQIYKTGKACPAHMIVTETMDRVLVTFYKTHVGHGPCPYFEPREPKKPKLESASPEAEAEPGSALLVCDACGLGFAHDEQFRAHCARHQQRLPCHYCPRDFEDIDAWTHHVRVEHNMAGLF